MGSCCASNIEVGGQRLNMTHDNLTEVKVDNLKYIKDPTKKFKYLFPFYRMSIETLDYKLEKLYGSKGA